MQWSVVFFVVSVFLVGMGLGEQEDTDDSKAMESQRVKMAKAEAEGKDAKPQTTSKKVMLVPPMSLMLAVPHPSGRYLMLFPTSSQIVPLMPVPYVQHDHPAIFTARHQLLYTGPSEYPHQSQHQTREYNLNRHHFSNGYLRRLPVDVN